MFFTVQKSTSRIPVYILNTDLYTTLKVYVGELGPTLPCFGVLTTKTLTLSKDPSLEIAIYNWLC